MQMAEIRLATSRLEWPRSESVESEAPERFSTDLIGQQVTNETSEAVEGFMGVARYILQEKITKLIVELTEDVEVAKLTSHERVNIGVMSITEGREGNP